MCSHVGLGIGVGVGAVITSLLFVVAIIAIKVFSKCQKRKGFNEGYYTIYS